MHEQLLSEPQAQLEMALLDAQASSVRSSDVYLWLIESGVPPEIAIRLKGLMDVTQRIGSKVVRLGKIIVLKVTEFIKAHPNLTVGMALGAALSSLTISVPLIGALLAPASMLVGATFGAIAGNRLDSQRDPRATLRNGAVDMGMDLIEVAQAFFQLFIATVVALATEFKGSPQS